jgi:hypothetical protein
LPFLVKLESCQDMVGDEFFFRYWLFFMEKAYKKHEFVVRKYFLKYEAILFCLCNAKNLGRALAAESLPFKYDEDI